MNTTDWNPAAVIGLASPFLVLIGVLVKVGADWLIAKVQNRAKSKEIIVSEKLANVSEQEAQTHQIQAIFEGFNTSLQVVSKRAENAEAAVSKLEARVDTLEEELEGERKARRTEREMMVAHIRDLEELVPSPPGPPTRPIW